jgi:hypothetical protein
VSGYGSRFREWFSGSYYELAIELSLAPSDARLSAAVDALWTAPRMEGPWSDKSYAHIVAIGLPDSGNAQHYYGVLTVDGMGEVPCVSWMVRESDGGADWLSVSVPTRALVQHGLQELVHEAREFTALLDRAFVEVGARVFSRAGFELGIVGEETSGMYSATSFGEKDLPVTGFLVPEPLWSRVQVAGTAELVAPGLKWISPGPA